MDTVAGASGGRKGASGRGIVVAREVGLRRSQRRLVARQTREVSHTADRRVRSRNVRIRHCRSRAIAVIGDRCEQTQCTACCATVNFSCTFAVLFDGLFLLFYSYMRFMRGASLQRAPTHEYTTLDQVPVVAFPGKHW